MRSNNNYNNYILKVFAFIFLLLSQIYSKSQVFFSPDDNPTKQLIREINRSKEKIYIAIYMLTDRKIAQALIDAKNKRKVNVQIVADKINVENKMSKINFLKQNGIDIFIFNPGGRQLNPPLMHNKFAILDNKIWSGSFNWTISANIQNHENVILIDEQDVYQKYLNHFEKLKKRCTLCRAESNKSGLKCKIKNFLKSLRFNYRN